jgi:SEC-C motif domain protein
MPSAMPCPCGSGHGLAACCGRLHAGAPAPNAEALMRSRYSAYVLGLADYLLATWHPSTRPTALPLDPAIRWLGLEIRAQQRIDSDQAEVEFVARFRIGGAAAVRLHERSHFVCEDGRWYYVDGEVSEQAAGRRKH